ncbi:hypothetical protein [Xanthobacter sp.]|uniref:hypothetical protein n=1 Tax=Xanthobacter sp. TaxID=35809 RepID=UPI0025CF57FA|nr:hypothetical protein [Xanthobacter sp.]
MTKADYIPELSEVRMERRAPEAPYQLEREDHVYVHGCLRQVEAAFGLDAFPGVAFDAISGRALIQRFIVWWRTLEPENPQQVEAHAQLPGAIRLLDTVSAFLEEQAGRG